MADTSRPEGYINKIKCKTLITYDYVLQLSISPFCVTIFFIFIITYQRWKSGVASTLNYVSLDDNSTSPLLIPYPDWETNLLDEDDEKNSEKQVSIFRINIDKCDRLWAVDTGLADILGEGKQISSPAILVYDLNTDKLIRKYQLKKSDLESKSFFANIVIDAEPDNCDNAFAYIPDLGGYGLVVYSWAKNDSWRIHHNFFHFEPLYGDMTVGGVNFQWTDGVFGLALSDKKDNGYKTLYFHALASVREFSVSTEVLQNETVATDPHNYYQFKLEGYKGEKSQSTTSGFDGKTDVLFLTQISKDAIGCWNTKKPLNEQNLGIVAQDNEKLIFPNDLTIDQERNLWVLSNKMANFIYRGLNTDEINYRVLKTTVDDAISSSAVCQS
ncbi:L-dopachrome tautomerase yellow-f2 [Agrilus planipennis]|uniref:L-dopachrome tautomerase yellow-f2 n=1 Tax=Agrilus planipennis TaxID=224129 RepID=A0A1W4WTU6_AGRPL|nr:L-dopachrome tautomerase yellow-f2 [Agrilus planipennis]